MTDYHGFLKNFQSIINAYQDIGTIYAKLEAQGHLERIISLLMEIFNEEHEFTLSELQRYGRENNQREEDFLEEQYELNSNIFRRNFTLVIQSLAEEMGKSLLEKFKRFYGQNHKKNSNASKFELNFVDEQKAIGVQKPQYKAEMPEIQEEIESTGKISPLKSSPKSGRSGTEFISNTARSFELNIEDLNSRAKFTHDDKPTTPTKTQPDSTATQSTKPAEPSIRQEPLTEVSPLLAQRKNEGQRQPPPKSLNSENLMYVSAEFKQIKENLKSPNSGREGAIEQGPGHYRSISHERTSMGPGKGKANSARGLSPSATNRVPKSATTSISSSKFSLMPPSTFDPSSLDSDFGHIRGSSFGKSERTGLFYPNSVPGPGSYEAEDIMKAVQKRAPTASFPRSPKFSVFDKALTESPGAIYYPSHHFVSK